MIAENCKVLDADYPIESCPILLLDVSQDGDLNKGLLH